MKVKTWLIVLGITVAVLLSYQWHAHSVGRLEGEIKARGESIKQLSELAATKQRAYERAKVAYVKTPTLESCSLVLLTCEDRHETDTAQIALLNKQIADWKKLNNKGKLFGFLPRPTVQAGVCVDRRIKPEICLSAGFPILK